MKKILLLISSSLLLIACQQSEVAEAKKSNDAAFETQSLEAPITKKKTPLVNDDTISEVPIAVAVKTGTGLHVVHRLSSERAKIGVPFEVELDFYGAADSSFMAEISATPGINLTTGRTASVEMNEVGKSKTQTITLVPQAEGIHYINIFQAGAKMKPSVIRIIVGDKDIKEYLQTPGTLVEQEDGSKVISMKADEG